jgi:ubiquinone/menaquinone biosynthesis C-methylase UbiE
LQIRFEGKSVRLKASRLRRPQSNGRPTEEHQRTPESAWFWDHYEWAAGQILEFIAGTGASLQDRDIADVGCGDGILTLGLTRRAGANRVVGFDVNPVNISHLLNHARNEGVSDELPIELEFSVSAPEHLPAESSSFDFITTWSAFEHIADPLAVLKEIRRVLRPQGLLFLQLWPFYLSERGSHLWDWFPEPFHHLLQPQSIILEQLEASDLKSPDSTDMMAREFRRLNRITLDELHRCLVAAGLSVVKLELLTNAVLVPRELARYPLSELGISGVKLLAIPS